MSANPRDAMALAETVLTKKLSALFNAQLAKLRSEIGDGSEIPETFWAGLEEALEGALLPSLQLTAERGHRDLMDQAPQPKASTAENIRKWLATYGFDLIKDITDFSRDRVEDGIAEYLSGGMTLQELVDVIGTVFSSDRALRIAITETTRAYDRGDQEATRELKEAGFKVLDIWNTRNDDLVDEDCQEREGLESKDWPTRDRPPLHVNCRCTVGHRIFS